MTSQSGTSDNPVEVDQLFADAVRIYGDGDVSGADKLCQEILQQFPEHAQTLALLSAIRVHQNRLEHALELSNRAVELAPDDVKIINVSVDALNRCEKPVEALAAADKALSIDPGYPEAHVNRGVALTALYRFGEARKSFERALELKPELKLIVYGNLAMMHSEEGQYETARKYAEAVVEDKPGVYAYNYIRFKYSVYTPSVTRRQERDNMAAVWESIPAVDQVVSQPVTSPPLPEKKLKVGYLSSDFKRHPVAEFLKPILGRHDRRDFTVKLYDTTPDSDEYGESLHGLADEYHCGVAQTDKALAQSISDDGVDILVELTGLMMNNRLNVLRYRAAPIQASWIGYSGTSALKEMDYVIADNYVCPPDADADFTENIVRLPDNYLCSEPGEAPLMASTTWNPPYPGITFGSFNNHMKLNSSVVRVWAEILKRVPNSRLFLKAPRFSNADLRRHVRKQFEACGVAPERLKLSGPVDRLAHLIAYNEVDIALDPFPYCGTTTTVEALSMGVPVVTLVGERWVQRTSYGFLSGMGWDSLCAFSEKEYIDIAIGLAKNPAQLQSMKATGREKFRASPMCDPDRFTRHLEAAYRMMWQRHCESERAS